MPQIALRQVRASLALMIVALCAGCSDPKNDLFNPDTGKHKASWLPSGHMASATVDLTVCADCHGQDFSGGISSVGCTNCHMGGPASVHPAGWLRDACYNHGVYAQNNGTTACANAYCHGPSLAGVAGSGPSCTACHAMPHAATCGTCHGLPPATGKHALHTSTPLNYIVCGSCHSAACADHANGAADVAIAGAFRAKSAGTVSYNRAAHTCAKVSCHGGQTTPSWTTGTAITQCTQCHSFGTSEYNGFSSGEHDRHVRREGISCTQCHDPARLAANHFSSLQTTVMEGPPWQTIYQSIQYNGTQCANPCHDPESWWR